MAYMSLIWYLSSNPSDAVINTGFSFDRGLKESLHLVEFGILYLLGVLALLSFDKLHQRSFNLLAGVSALYGLVDEFHQYFVPSRSATVTDLAKDVAGVLLAWYITRIAYLNPRSRVGLYFLWAKKMLTPPAPSKSDSSRDR